MKRRFKNFWAPLTAALLVPALILPAPVFSSPADSSSSRYTLRVTQEGTQPSGLEEHLKNAGDNRRRVYLDPVIRDGKLVNPGEPFFSGRAIPSDFWSREEVSRAEEVVIEGVSAYGKQGQGAVFSVGGNDSVTTNQQVVPGQSIRLRVVMDPATQSPLRAYEMETGRLVYSSDEDVEVYLNPVIKNGKLEPGQTPFWRGGKLGALWRRSEVKGVQSIAIFGKATRKRNRSPYAEFSFSGKTYVTTHRIEDDSPPELLMVVDVKSQAPTEAFLLSSGEKVFSLSDERFFQIHLDPPMRGGQLVDVEEPFLSLRILAASFWDLPAVQKSKEVVIDGVAAFNGGGRTVFRVGSEKMISINRPFDSGHPMQLRVVMDPRTRTSLRAYDMATGEEVYSAARQVRIYLDPVVKKGRLKSSSRLFHKVSNIQGKLWDRINEVTQKPVALDGVPTVNRRGQAIFFLGTAKFRTTRAYSADHPLRLLVIVDPRTRLPSVAYDQETGERVYRFDRRINVYLDPRVANGKLEDPGEPLVRISVNNATLWERTDVRAASVVALDGVQAFEMQGKYGFALGGTKYRTARPFDASRPLHLLVLADSATRKPLTVFDQETGEKLYDSQEKAIEIFLDPKLQDGRLVAASAPYKTVRVVGQPLWKELASKAETAGFLGVRGFHQKGVLAFSVSKTTYKTDVPLARGSFINLLVVARAADQTPVEAFVLETGQKIFPPDSSRIAPSLKSLADLAASKAGWVTDAGGLEEVVWKVAPEAVKLAPVTVKTADDGITVPIGDVIYPNEKKGRLKLVLPAEYRLAEARPVTVSVDHQMAQIYSRPDGRFANGYVVRIDLIHQDQPVTEYFAFKGEGNGFDRVIPGITALLRIALSNRNWLDRDRAKPLGPFPAEATKYGRIISLGTGTYPGGGTGPVQMELPREQVSGGRASRPVTLRMEWREKAYPQTHGEALDGYVIEAVVDPGSAQEQTFQYRFTGQPPGLISPQMEELIEEVADAIIATEGRPGDLLDVLLALHSERYTREQIQSFIRRFEELNLGEMVERRGRGGMGRGRILLEFYFQQASLVNQKEARDRQTLIQVFLKVAFRELASPATRDALMAQVEARRSEGRFFEELAVAAQEMVEQAMVYQPAHIKTRLLPHQSVAAYFLSRHPQAYNGDFTGLGKSIESLAGMDPSWKVFIAAPASLVPNWKKEISKHVDPEILKKMKVVVLRGTPEQKRKQIEELPPEGCICIGSIQGLRFIRNLPEAELRQMFGGDLDLLIVDESQFGANYRGQGAKTNAQQAEALQVIPSKRRWYLSATGYGSNPMQLFATLAALTRGTPQAKNFDDFKRFSRLYPPEKAEGLRYLRAEMRRLSIARESEEVMDRYEDPAVSGVPLAEQGLRLPNLVEVPYRQSGAYVLNDEQILLLLQMVHNFRDFAEWYNNRVPEDQRLDEEQMNPFTKLRFIFYLLMDPKRVGGETVSPVWEALDQVVGPYLAQGKKGILYVQNQAIAMEPLLERQTQHGVRVARIDGTVSGHASHAMTGLPVLGYFGPDGELVIDPLSPQSEPVDAKTWQKHLFQTDPNVPLVAVGAKAGGVGLDLTAAEFQVDVQPAEFFTQERQMNGRAIRPDPKRPRLNVDKIRMVGVFPENFTPERILAGETVGSSLVIPDEYRELAARLAQSGTPAELAVERLSVGKRVFKYVMLDLATDQELDLFDPSSLGQAIPGFMEDPTMEQYLSALSSERLQETLQVFLPLYQQAQDAEMRREILRLAELYFRTGRIKDLDKLLEILAQEEVGSVELIASLLEIPNRYAREAWLNRLIPMVTGDFPANNIGLSDIAASLDFLAEEAPFLVLPLVHTVKGFENGGVASPLTQLLSEVEQTVSNAQDKRLIYQQFALWMLAVSPQTGLEEDPRDALHELLDRHGGILTDRKVPLADRLSVTEQLLRLVGFPPARSILLGLASPTDLVRLRDGLRQAAEAAVQQQFGLSPAEAGDFVQYFPAYLTALQIQAGLRAKYPEQAKRLSEEMLHIARGDYPAWRNEQKGDRLQGDRVTYRDDQPELWAAFTREESVLLDQPVLVNYERQRAQMVEQAQQVLAGLTAEEASIIGQVEGEWVRGQFRQWADRPNGFRKSASMRRRTLAEARRSLVSEPPAALKEPETSAIKQEGMNPSLEPARLAASIEERLKEYARTEEWLQFVRRTQGLSDKVPTVGELAELRTLAAQLTGRATQAGAVHVADSLEDLGRALTRLREKQRVDGVRVQFTTDPSLMIERGMLHPHLVDCFNGFGNPDQTNALVDDLGSRNKILALVWPKSVPLDDQGRPDLRYRDRILARVVVKVKRTEDGTPVLFPERPLAAGAYRFEPEILEALKRAKMPELAPLGARLGREGKPPSKKRPETRIWLFETGGYADWEYVEPLFRMMRRSTTTDNPIHHRGEILETGLEETPSAQPVKIPFIGSIGYEKISLAGFVAALKSKKVKLVVDVRHNNYSYRPEFSKTLGAVLQAEGIRYLHMPSLGSPKELREGHQLGKNDAWFAKEYGEHLAQHPEAVDQLLKAAEGKRVALLCYEANPDQCHRSVILQEVARRAQVGAPIIDLRFPMFPIVEPDADQSGLEEKVSVYLNPKIEDRQLKTQGEIFTTVHRTRIGDVLWKTLDPLKVDTVLLEGVPTAPPIARNKETGFYLKARYYASGQVLPIRPGTPLRVAVDVQNRRPIGAWVRETGQLVYWAEDLIQVYLDPPMEEGRLKENVKPVESIKIMTASVLDRAVSQGAQRVVLTNVRSLKTEGEVFPFFGSRYATHREYNTENPARFLVVVDPRERIPLLAYDTISGEKVFDTEKTIFVYLDPPMEGGKLNGRPEFYQARVRIPATFWKQEALEKADRVVFGNYPTAYDSNGNVIFSVFNRPYRTRRSYDREHPLRLLVVVDRSARVAVEAYDEQGEQVYPAEGMSQIYLNPKIIQGRLKEGSRPFLSVEHMGSKVWETTEIQQAREIALAPWPTIHQSGNAVFHLGHARYVTDRSFDAGHELQLLVVVNPTTQLPKVAYDMENGEEVYPASLQPIQIHIDPPMEAGVIQGNPRPARVALQVPPKFFDRQDVRKASRVVLADVSTYSQAGKAAFSLWSRPYRLERPYRSKRPLKLSVVIDAQSREVLAAYDQKTGEQVYPRSDGMPVYLDPPVAKGLLVGSPEPYTRVSKIDNSFWTGADVQRAKVVVVENVATHDQQGRLTFSLGGGRYRTTQLFVPAQEISLRVVLNSATRLPTAAFNQVTGEQVYPLFRPMQLYLNSPIQRGRLVGEPKPLHEGERIPTKIWNGSEVQAAPAILLSNVKTHNIDGNAAFTLFTRIYSTSRPYDAKQPLYLNVLMDPRTRKPSAAYEMETGEQIYPDPDAIRVYVDPEMKGGRLIGSPDPVEIRQHIRASLLTKRFEIRRASTVVLANVPVFNRQGNVAFTFLAKRYRTTHPFPTQPTRLLLTVDPKVPVLTAAYDMATGQPLSFSSEEPADKRLKPLARLAASPEGWVTDEPPQSGLEEITTDIVMDWAEGREGQGLMVVSPDVLGSAAGPMIRQTVAQLPDELSSRILLSSDSASAEDVAMTVLERDPLPDRVWVVGSFGPAFTGMLRGFTSVTELAPGSGLEEFLAQVGLMLGVPVEGIESGLEEIRNASGLREAA